MSLPVHLSPRPVRTLTRRISASRAAADLRRERVLILGYTAVLTIALLIGLLSEGWFLTWHGFEPIPTTVAR